VKNSQDLHDEQIKIMTLDHMRFLMAYYAVGGKLIDLKRRQVDPFKIRKGHSVGIHGYQGKSVHFLLIRQV